MSRSRGNLPEGTAALWHGKNDRASARSSPRARNAYPVRLGYSVAPFRDPGRNTGSDKSLLTEVTRRLAEISETQHDLARRDYCDLHVTLTPLRPRPRVAASA